LTYVQFVDGDCELFPGWLDQGVAALDAKPDGVIVCGRLRERHPEASVYNRLCAMEWQMTPGEVLSCGCIFLVRAEAFRAVSGFRPDVVAVPAGSLPRFELKAKRFVKKPPTSAQTPSGAGA
jgi:hypothetical protein